MIGRALDSVVAQNYPNLECIVLDAGSTDGSLEIIDRYKDHINVFRSHPDNGPAAAWNEGVQKSSGEIICFLNSDDWFEHGALITVGKTFCEDRSLEMVNLLGRTVGFSKNGNVVIGHECTADVMDISRGNVKGIHPNCRFYKKNLFKNYGGVIDSINGKAAMFCDYEFITRLSLYNIKNTTIPIIGYNYFGHEGSISFNTAKYTKLKMYNEKVFYIEELFRKCADVIDDKVRAQLNKEYKKSYPRRVVKNIVDKDFATALRNIKNGTKIFGLFFVLSVARYYASYSIRFNKVFRKLAW